MQLSKRHLVDKTVIKSIKIEHYLLPRPLLDFLLHGKSRLRRLRAACVKSPEDISSPVAVMWFASAVGSHQRKEATVGTKWLEMAATRCKSGLVSIKKARVSAAKIRVSGLCSFLVNLTRVGNALYITRGSSFSSTSHLKYEKKKSFKNS